jgi:hypothetical protein
MHKNHFPLINYQKINSHSLIFSITQLISFYFHCISHAFSVWTNLQLFHFIPNSIEWISSHVSHSRIISLFDSFNIDPPINSPSLTVFYQSSCREFSLRIISNRFLSNIFHSLSDPFSLQWKTQDYRFFLFSYSLFHFT